MAPFRPATATDFPYIRAIAGQEENRRYIPDEDAAGLQAHLETPAHQLLIWQRDGQPAGFALFCELDHPANRAELLRLALDTAGGGRGHQFMKDLVSYAFDDLGVDRIWLDVTADNLRAQKVYERAGFRHEGTLRQHWRRPTGDMTDLKLYGLLRSDWPG